MSESVPEKHSVRVLEGIQNWMFNHRTLVVRRVAVILLLLYFAVMVHAGSHVGGDVNQGFYFATPSFALFPFPYVLPPGYVVILSIRPLTPIEVFIYVVFIQLGIWMVWVILGIIYIMMPLVLRVYRTKTKVETQMTEVRSDRGEKIDVLTVTLVGLSAIFSVTTFSIGCNLENYGPLPLILVIGLSTVMVSNMGEQESRLRLGSVILLVLGLMVIIANGIFIPDSTPAFQLGMFGTGLAMVFIALATIRIRESGGEHQE